MRVSSSRPPQCLTSGMITWTARLRLSGAKPATPNRISPPAIGCWIRRRISSVSSTSLGRHRLLVPRELLRLQPASDPLGERHVEEAVAIDHQLDVRPDGVAHGGTTQAMPFSTAASIAAAGEPGGGNPSNGAAFTARNPSARPPWPPPQILPASAASWRD